MNRTAGSIGTVFGRLEVIGRAPTSERGASRVRVRCVCGTEKIMHTSNLLRGHRYGVDQSCGCARHATAEPVTPDPKPDHERERERTTMLAFLDAHFPMPVGAPENKLSESQ